MKKSFKQICREKGVDYYRALKRRQAGLSEDKIFNKEYIRSSRITKEITIHGRIYPNLQEAKRVLNPPASVRTISRWIKEGMSPEEAFKKIPNPGYKNGFIYLITNKLNGKRYVGQSIQNLELRWKNHIEQAYYKKVKSYESLHAAIRKYGKNSFEINIIDEGVAKNDLRSKERFWIKELDTMVPKGYNISKGGESGGSIKKPTKINDKCFESVKDAALYLSKIKNISFLAAKKRIQVGRINAKKPAKPGESLVQTKIYKSWSRIVHGALNPKSKDYIEGLEIYKPWLEFENFLDDVGNSGEKGIAFTRINKKKGFFPDNCKWLSKSESCRLNAEYMKREGLFIRKHKRK